MKKFFLSLALTFFSISAFAVSLEDFSLSVEPLIGIRNGQIDEYVFLKNSSYSDDKLSELNWEIKNEVFMGAKIHSSWRNFFNELSFSFGIPKNSGEMQDSDWLNLEKANQAAYLYKTNYSESDNHLDKDFSFGIKGGYDFLIKNRFNIKPAIAFDYSNIKFTANGGTGWYGKLKSGGGYYAYNDTAHQTIHDFSGKDVVDYNRISYCLWLGSDFSVNLPAIPKVPGNFILNAGFFFSPYFYAVSYDTHIVNGYEYADLTVDYFAAFKGNFGVTYEVTKRHAISLMAGLFYLKTIRGDSFSRKQGSSTYVVLESTDGGAGAKWFDITLSYKFKIF